jgi:hypothetical protein
LELVVVLTFEDTGFVQGVAAVVEGVAAVIDFPIAVFMDV